MFSMDLADTDRLATETFELSGVSPGDRVPLAALARRLGIPVHLVPNLRPRGWLADVDGRATIALRKSLRGAEFRFTLGHELGHWALRRFGIRPADPVFEERIANAFSARLVVPKEHFVRLCTGASFEDLARLYGTTQACIALRYGEVTGRPVAVVVPAHVYGRGDAQWPDEGTVRMWARRGGPGLARTRFTDGAGVALMGAEAV